MSQTYGSQIFGPWYDIIGWFFGSGIFYYLAFSAESMPLSLKTKLPAFLMNTKLCIGIATFLAALGVYTATTTLHPATAAPTAPPGWLQIHSNGKGDFLFVDPGSISRKDDIVEYWSKITFKNPRVVGQNLRASMFMDRYAANCKSKTIEHLQSLGIADTGQPINFQLTPKDKSIPVPSDIGHPDAILFRYVCGQ